MILSLRSAFSGEKVAKSKVMTTLYGHCSEGDQPGILRCQGKRHLTLPEGQGKYGREVNSQIGF